MDYRQEFLLIVHTHPLVIQPLGQIQRSPSSYSCISLQIVLAHLFSFVTPCPPSEELLPGSKPNNTWLVLNTVLYQGSQVYHAWLGIKDPQATTLGLDLEWKMVTKE